MSCHVSRRKIGIVMFVHVSMCVMPGHLSMTRSAGVCHSNAVLELRWFSRLTLRNMLVAARFLVQDKAAHLRKHGFVGKPHTIRRFPAQNRSQPVASLTVMLQGSRLYVQCGFRILRPIVCPLTKNELSHPTLHIVPMGNTNWRRITRLARHRTNVFDATRSLDVCVCARPHQWGAFEKIRKCCQDMDWAFAIETSASRSGARCGSAHVNSSCTET